MTDYDFEYTTLFDKIELLEHTVIDLTKRIKFLEAENVSTCNSIYELENSLDVLKYHNE